MDAIHARGAPQRPLADMLEWPAPNMRIIARHICRAVLSHALLGLAVFTFIFLVPLMPRLMELIARHSAAPGDIALLLLCAFPGVLSFTIPIAVLIGTLIGLRALSADSELIAMNALGMGQI